MLDECRSASSPRCASRNGLACVPNRKPLRQSNFRRRVWAPALPAVELTGIHFHDLRHTGNTLSANAGANVRELMDRMGHSSARAAMVYLHSTGERQRKIADALSDLARGELAKSRKPRRQGKASGTAPGHPPEPLRSADRMTSRWPAVGGSHILSAPGRTRTRDPLLRRSFRLLY
jgi:hypothetical protein